MKYLALVFFVLTQMQLFSQQQRQFFNGHLTTHNIGSAQDIRPIGHLVGQLEDRFYMARLLDRGSEIVAIDEDCQVVDRLYESNFDIVLYDMYHNQQGFVDAIIAIEFDIDLYTCGSMILVYQDETGNHKVSFNYRTEFSCLDDVEIRRFGTSETSLLKLVGNYDDSQGDQIDELVWVNNDGVVKNSMKMAVKQIGTFKDFIFTFDGENLMLWDEDGLLLQKRMSFEDANIQYADADETNIYVLGDSTMYIVDENLNVVREVNYARSVQDIPVDLSFRDSVFYLIFKESSLGAAEGPEKVYLRSYHVTDGNLLFEEEILANSQGLRSRFFEDRVQIATTDRNAQLVITDWPLQGNGTSDSFGGFDLVLEQYEIIKHTIGNIVHPSTMDSVRGTRVDIAFSIVNSGTEVIEDPIYYINGFATNPRDPFHSRFEEEVSYNGSIAPGEVWSDTVQIIMYSVRNRVFYCMLASYYCQPNDQSGSNNFSCQESLLVSNEESHLTELIIYPNPSDGAFNWAGDKSLERVRIYDLNGRMVSQFSGPYQDLSHLPSGVYMAELDTGETTIVKKWMKR